MRQHPEENGSSTRQQPTTADRSRPRDDDHVDVATRSGIVRGGWRTTDGPGTAHRSAAFLGIPFAQPPVGPLRFAAPVPVAPWSGVQDARRRGATAQRGDPGATLIPEPSVAGESTLNVDVFTPSPHRPGRDGGLPVLVWIHGGGFLAGSPASPWYDGRSFNRDRVVTVTLSYRLGFDGFGWIDGAPQNRGVRDWLLGLEWVRDNIAAFGGDPSRVTIAGQSAGGGAVLTLLGMEKAQHLFHGAYSLSGALADVPEEHAVDLAKELARRGGVPATRAGFAGLGEERMLELQADCLGGGQEGLARMLDRGLPLGPTIDGDLISRPTRDSYRLGVGRDTPLVVGTTDDEFTMALLGEAEELRDVPVREVLSRFGLPPTLHGRYLAENADIARLGHERLAGRLITDLLFRAPTVATLLARGDAPTWAYRFSWPSGAFGFAEHCLDVPFFFDCLDGPDIEPLAGPTPPQELAGEMHRSAVRFVETGHPGWPRFEAGRRLAHVYDTPSSTVEDAYAAVSPLL